MHRIDSPTAQKDKFGAGKNGYTDGNPQVGTPATDLNAAMFDSLQEEVCTVIEGVGIELSAQQNDQLKIAITQMIDSAISRVPGAPVSSVNGKTGAVVLTAADVHALPDTYTPPAAPVTSVNSKTGAVSLTAADVGALPSSYSAPVTSVNGMEGAVVIDVGYTPSNPPPSGLTTTGNTAAYYTHSNGQIFLQSIGGIASNSSSNPDVTVTLPASFPTGILGIGGTYSGSGGDDSDSWWTATIVNAGSFTLHTRNTSGTFSFVVAGY